jgi:hypothetical protein
VSCFLFMYVNIYKSESEGGFESTNQVYLLIKIETQR